MHLGPGRRRGAYTLVELMVGLAAASLLMAGMASAMYFAGRSLDHGGAKAVQTKRANDAWDDVALDLAHATAFSQRTSRAVTFTVPDRDGNETPETIGYSWSAVAGEPLLVSRNGGAPAALAADVRAFNLAYRTRAVTGTGFVKGMIDDPALVARWKLDETAGTTANDSTTNANQGTLRNGPTWVAGHSGNGLRLDGSNDFVVVPNKTVLSITDQLSLSAWIWANNGSLSGFRFILKKGTTSGSLNYGIGTYNREFAFGFYNGSLQGWMTSGLNLQTGRWYHVAATWEPEGSSHRIRLYVDGVQKTTTTISAALLTNAQAIHIGRDVSGYYWSGILDDIRVYSRKLSADEVLAITGGTL